MAKLFGKTYTREQLIRHVGSLSQICSGKLEFALGRSDLSLIQWFIYLVVISFFVAYISKLALGAGAEYKEVFRVAGTVAILGYATYPIYE